jgi:hypothetical protein
MAEKQPSAYVVSRYALPTPRNNFHIGDNIPVKVYDTRRKARAYEQLMSKRSKTYGYVVHRVKQG